MELIKRQQDIINYMVQYNEWHTGKEIASLFNVSIRTIRSDITCINAILNEEIIVSSKHYGYKLDTTKYNSSKSFTNYLTTDERKTHIIIQLLSNPNTPINFQDLADNFCISEYTLTHDINAIRTQFLELPYNNILLERKSDYLILHGNNVECAKTFHTYMKSNNLHQNLTIYKDSFKSIDLNNYIDLIKQNTTAIDFNRYFTFDDFLLLTCIFIEQSSHYNQPEITLFELNTKEIQYISTLYKISEHLNHAQQSFFVDSYIKTVIPLIEIEKEELIIKKTTSKDDEMYSLIVKILNEVKQKYSLDICTNEKVILDFLIHIKTALLRISKGVTIINPLIEFIRLNYTFLFDVAYFISEKLSNYSNIEITKNEISFFVVYLISPLKNIKDDLLQQYSINILLYIIEGPSLTKNIEDLVLSNITNDKVSIDLATTQSEYELKKNKDYDLIITTMPHLNVANTRCCYINPSLSLFDFKNINKHADQIYIDKRTTHFSNLFDYFFQESFCTFEHAPLTREVAIKAICNRLEGEQVVPSNFYTQVMDRESLISTAFDSGIALPHAIENSCFKSKIYFMNFSEGIDWENIKIKNIFLFAIAKEDIGILNLIYRIIIDICSSPIFAPQLSKIKNYDELKELMQMVYLKL